MRSAIVKDVRMWLAYVANEGWVMVSPTALDGIPLAPPTPSTIVLQVAECQVDGKTLLVLFAHHPPELVREDWRALLSIARDKFGGAPIAVVTHVGPGHVRVETFGADEAQRAATFLAAAVIQASWGWDESARIRVETADQTVEVEPRFDGLSWRATMLD